MKSFIDTLSPKENPCKMQRYNLSYIGIMLGCEMERFSHSFHRNLIIFDTERIFPTSMNSIELSHQIDQM